MSSFFSGGWEGAGFGPFGYSGFFGVPQSVVMDQAQAAPVQRVRPDQPVDRSMASPWGPAYGLNGYNGTIGFGYSLPGLGYDPAPPSSPYVYWWMRKCPAVILAHAVVTLPFLAGSRTIEIVDDRGNESLAEKMKEEATKRILPLFAKMLAPATEDLNFGYWLQEIAWDRVDGLTDPVKALSVLPTEATLHVNRQREFAGFQIGDQYRDKRYAFLTVNNPWFHPTLGEARAERAKKDWWMIIQSEQTIGRASRKAAGKQMMIGLPIGKDFVDENGKPIWPQHMVQEIADQQASGDITTYPMHAFMMKDIIANPKLAEIPAVKIDSFDWEDMAPVIMSEISVCDRSERNVIRAYCQPERAATEGKHGTKAESKGQTQDISIRDSERKHADYCVQASEQVLATWVRTNWGPNAPVLSIQPAPLADQQQEFLQMVANTLLADRNTGPTTQTYIDVPKLMEKTEIPQVEPGEQKKKQKALEAQSENQTQPGEDPEQAKDPVAASADRLKRLGIKPAAEIVARLNRRAGINGNGRH